MQNEMIWMIIGVYGVLGGFLFMGSEDLEGSRQLINFTIWGACGAHGTAMLLLTFADWETEWEHVMPYGDVTGLYLFAGALWHLKSKVESKGE